MNLSFIHIVFKQVDVIHIIWISMLNLAHKIILMWIDEYNVDVRFSLSSLSFFSFDCQPFIFAFYSQLDLWLYHRACHLSIDFLFVLFCKEEFSLLFSSAAICRCQSMFKIFSFYSLVLSHSSEQIYRSLSTFDSRKKKEEEERIWQLTD